MKKTFWILRLTLLVICVTTMLPVFAQSLQIKGSVKTKQGEALPGVSIVEKGTLNGTVTTIDGDFAIKVASSNASLVFTYVGYQTKEVSVDGKTQVNAILEENILGLDEVVVIGYGEVKKSDLTGSVSTVKVEKLQSTPANSIEGLLQGRSSGVQVINSSQDPGAGSTVRIRGGSSLRGSNSPLIVVDGFPLGEAGDLKQVNPADIQSVEILKDASASAIYGSRGANGVIMVTTKKAAAGTTTIDVQQQTTISQFSSKLNMWGPENALLMAELSNEEMANAGLEITYNGKTNSNGVYYPSIDEIATGAWPYRTDWADVVFREMPVSNNTTLSVRSANAQTSFNLSANYLKQNGVYIKDDYTKGIVNLSIIHKVSDKLRFTTSNIISRNWRNNNGGLAYWRNPLWPVTTETGDYYRTTITDYGHPLAQTDHVMNKSQGFDFINSALVDYQIIPCLNIKSQINYKYGSSATDQYYPSAYSEAGYFNNGAAYMSNWTGQDLLSETYLTFNKEFGGIHKISAMAGYSYQNSLQKSTSMGSYDFVNEALGNENMSAGDPEKNTHSNSLVETELVSAMARFNYTLNDKYLMTATMRSDGSSKFGANNKWASFPSAALSWKAHNEEFIKNLGIFDELKVRMSYGISGNQGISAYQTLSRYGNETYYSNGKWNTVIGPGYVVGYEGADGRYRVWGGIPNNDLKWETTAQPDLGIDVAFFNRRLRVTADIYEKITTDLLRERLLSLSSGYNRIWVNDGERRNKGIDIQIEGDIISNKDFKLSSMLIFSKNKDKIVDLGESVASGLQVDANTGMEYEFTGYNFTQFRQSANILAIGQPVNVYYGYKTDGIIQTLAEGIEAGLSGALAQPGEFKYVDISGDGVINTDDRTIIGDPNPDFIASLAIDMTYKNFDVSVFLNGVYGNDVLYQGRIGQANVSPLRWTRDNPNNEYPSLYNGRQYYLSDWFIQDGSFLRVQNLNVGYNFNTSKIKFIQKARIYMNATNLYTFTKFDGYDPEVGLDGIYWGGYPRLRNWTIGLNLTF